VQACRLIAKKGLVTTLRAFAEFSREFPKATLAIAGEGPQLAELQTLADTLGIANEVEFTGFLSQAKLRERYANAHFFLHPSETTPEGDQEGIPNSMLEAMASGLPPIATTHGGIPEAVEQHISGSLVPEQDHASLAQALLTLARDSARYATMSSAAASRVIATFDLARQAGVLESYYREAIQIGPTSELES
jgi:colanic acid/amylovoran biosynthesis glycosyltransferase